MIDLTPLDVRKKRGDFRRILRGYDPEEVDTFMDLVAERFEELVRENLSLREDTERLARQLEALEGREKAVQDALVTAQKLREEVGDQSRREAEVLREQASRMAEVLKAEAETEIQRRLSEAESLVRERKRALEELERSRLKFLKSFRSLLEREMDAVDVEEARRPLEEIPLELEFRGWGRTDETGSEPGDDEAGEVKAEGEGFEPEEGEPDAGMIEMQASEEVEKPPEVHSLVEELEAEQGQGSEKDPFAESGELPTEVLHEDRASDDLPGGFDTQILEGAAPANQDSVTEVEDGEVRFEGTGLKEAKGDDDLSEIPQEPRWLFSLLKKSEEKDGEA
jgi:cell division initiation protein